MEQNARGYVQDSCTALNEAKNCLTNALQTVERDENRQRIQASLQAVENALNECGSTASILEQV
ncbi:hypothetical protein LCL95_09010 [Bacillus timonensis]|nr:hypothetical protein [Bacillus timonensis]